MCHLGHNKAGFSKRSDTRHEQYIFLSPTFPPWTRKLISSHCFSSSFFFRFSLHELNWRRDSQINSLSLPGKPWLQPDRPNPHGQIYPQLLLICTVFSHLLQELDFFFIIQCRPWKHQQNHAVGLPSSSSSTACFMQHFYPLFLLRMASSCAVVSFPNPEPFKIM